MANGNYTELPKGIKLSKDLKDFREFCLLEPNAQEFENAFQKFCKHQLIKQAKQLNIAAERI